MKKLLLALVVIGGLLTLPGCWCCRKACEDTCVEYHDDCNDRSHDHHHHDEDCDDRSHDHRHDDDCDGSYDDGKEGYYEAQGYRVKKSRKVVENRPSRVMHEPIHPEIIRRAEEQGKQCEYLDSQYGNQNRELNRRQLEMEAQSSRKNGNRNRKAVVQEEMELLDLE